MKVCIETSEISYLLGSIEKVGPCKANCIELKLPIDLGNEKFKNKTIKLDKNIEFTNLTAHVRNKNNDLTYTASLPSSPQQELLKMLNETFVDE